MSWILPAKTKLCLWFLKAFFRCKFGSKCFPSSSGCAVFSTRTYCIVLPKAFQPPYGPYFVCERKNQEYIHLFSMTIIIWRRNSVGILLGGDASVGEGGGKLGVPKFLNIEKLQGGKTESLTEGEAVQSQWVNFVLTCVMFLSCFTQWSNIIPILKVLGGRGKFESSRSFASWNSYWYGAAFCLTLRDDLESSEICLKQ